MAIVTPAPRIGKTTTLVKPRPKAKPRRKPLVMIKPGLINR